MAEKASAERFARIQPDLGHWEKVGDAVDQFIDLMINYRQSGHPGGSRSKVQAMVVTLLSGFLRWDIRAPEKRLSDRFILAGGHTAPLVYAVLTVLCEAMRAHYERTGDPRFFVPPEKAIYAPDLAGFRRRGGLPGHAEVHEKTLLIKFNTGPTAHGSAAAVGQALALKRAGLDEVKVVVFEGEGGHTAGVYHEIKNSAWGLGLDNLYLVLDWNDYGIDDHPVSAVVPGTPADWFKSYGWRVVGTEHGNDWRAAAETLLELGFGDNPGKVPSMAWLKTRKGRGYLVYDNKSHGTPHKLNCELFWRTKEPFAAKYGVSFHGCNERPPDDPEALRRQCLENLEIVAEVIRADKELCARIAGTLAELGESVPTEISGRTVFFDENPLRDNELYDFAHYPAHLYLAPGTSVANRQGLGNWGAWVNAWSVKKYGRPLFLVCSADLADSTLISGFGRGWEDLPGCGWYDREKNPEGVVLPQEITEFVNAGICAGLATTNLALDQRREFSGFLGACSTYGSFSYLKYGMMRLLSQIAQDSPLKTGVALWIVGHSGPETADDSRTHFGIFAPGVTQLFPDGRVINLHPWEYNEVPVVLGKALEVAVNLGIPIIALHLTRPPIQLPDRAALGLPSHFAAARGAYVMRDYRSGQPRMGTVIVQGTSTLDGICRVLPRLDAMGLNVKIVAAISHELFRLEPDDYQRRVLSEEDWSRSMCITNMARRTMHDWIHDKRAEKFTLSADWDDRWRTGGTLGEILDEARLTPEWLLEGITRFACHVKEDCPCAARL